MKILVLLSRVPYPLEKGDKLRAFNQVKRLAKHHEIILCCLNDGKLHKDAIEILTPYCKELIIIPINKLSIFFNVISGLFSSKPFQVSYFYHKNAQLIIDRLIEKHLPKHIYCQLIRVSEYAKKYTIIPKTLDYMDAFSTGMVRRAESAPFYLKLLFKSEALRLKNYESVIFTKYENKTIISEQDKQLISHHHKEKIMVIPNGVDTDFFKPLERKKDFDLVFTGNMNYPPNIESAYFLSKEILPLLFKKNPGIKLLISGADPAMKVRMLVSGNITVGGWVEDMRESYARAKIFIAPMRTGTGLQNKLLEAMAMGLPCITSTLVNNALEAVPGEEIMISDSPRSYADCIEKIISDPVFYNKIAENGYRFVLRNFNWDKTVDKLNSIISIE